MSKMARMRSAISVRVPSAAALHAVTAACCSAKYFVQRSTVVAAPQRSPERKRETSRSFDASRLFALLQLLKQAKRAATAAETTAGAAAAAAAEVVAQVLSAVHNSRYNRFYSIIGGGISSSSFGTVVYGEALKLGQHWKAPLARLSITSVSEQSELFVRGGRSDARSFVC